jgi:hypothetical protein
MASWEEVRASCPALADKVQRRFEEFGLALLATVRSDGSPRISGIEVTFAAGHLLLGMMPGSLKARDLLRDGHCALHSATVDKDVKQGDAKIAGIAAAVDDDATFKGFLAATGSPEGSLDGFHLFQVDVKEMSYLIPAGDHLDIEAWSERRGYRQIARR